ncbi:MAG: NDP-hexose 2,3-dehydratase family protein [Cellulomonadaceae bacterium]|jgi:oxidase EvaA|nr:NDP-hexose 2,3-dehydratase family protein [Cellulomonadaceae bacterium]
MPQPSLAIQIARSWCTIDGAEHALTDLHSWVSERNANTHVDIKPGVFSDDGNWFVDPATGTIRNRQGSFFTVAGLRQTAPDGSVHEQPVILQPEIGFLGFLAMERRGVLHFLVQAKIEPGNINKVQLSPTIQATKSNFTQAHGGKRPMFLEYFLDVDPDAIMVDQIQSEQSSRFFKKRNRNIIVVLDEEPEVTDQFRWMTLGQIKALMHYDNLVNMDTRTVLSCIPTSMMACSDDEFAEIISLFNDEPLARSVFHAPDVNAAPPMFHQMNNFKMFDAPVSEIIRLDELERWDWVNNELVCLDGGDFTVGAFDIAIEGREVVEWTQPLFKAKGIATFGLITTEDTDGVRRFLVRIAPEPGCFDDVEFGPSVQLEPTAPPEGDDDVSRFMFEQLAAHPDRVSHDVLLSEEGGRFYHEQNRNIVVDVDRSALTEFLGADPRLMLVDYWTLNTLNQVNNVLNIQLRNVLSLLPAVTPEDDAQ